MRLNENIQITWEDNMALMARYPDNYFDLAVVDPEYGIGEDGKKNHSRGKATNPTYYKPKQWDSKPADFGYFKELKRVSKDQIIFGANHFIENIPAANSSSWIVWDKQNGNNDFADCELAYTSFKTAVRMFVFRWAGMLQGSMKNKEIRIHPTQKPVKLYEWILLNYAKPNQKILDTHIGSMSIAIALHNVNKKDQMNLSLTACELDEDYFNDGIKRVKTHLQQLTIF